MKLLNKLLLLNISLYLLNCLFQHTWNPNEFSDFAKGSWSGIATISSLNIMLSYTFEKRKMKDEQLNENEFHPSTLK